MHLCGDTKLVTDLLQLSIPFHRCKRPLIRNLREVPQTLRRVEPLGSDWDYICIGMWWFVDRCWTVLVKLTWRRERSWWSWIVMRHGHIQINPSDVCQVLVELTILVSLNLTCSYRLAYILWIIPNLRWIPNKMSHVRWPGCHPAVKLKKWSKGKGSFHLHRY